MSVLTQFAVYDNGVNDSTSAVPAVLIGAIALFILAISVLIYLIHAYLLARLFKKAGVEAWKAWIPIYQYWPLLEMGGQRGFWAIFLLIPLVNLVSGVFIYIAMYHIGVTLGKEKWFVLIGISTPLLWVGWLGLDGSKWPSKKKAVSVTGGLKD